VEVVKKTKVSVWELYVEDNEQITLIAPNGAVLFTVNRGTALIIANMLRDEATETEEREEWRW